MNSSRGSAHHAPEATSRLKILACEKQPAEFSYQSHEILQCAEKYWFSAMPDSTRQLAQRVFKGAEIFQRYSAFPLEKIFSECDFEQKNDLYIQKSIELSEKALKKALDAASIGADEIDILITTSCTGFMIPSVDAYLVDKFKMKQNIQRLPVTEMGCAGGTAALIYANQFARANPEAKIAIVSVELPSITLQYRDFSAENLVSSAIFGDGAAAVILGQSNVLGPTIVSTEMYHFPQSTHLMGYQLKNSGLKIILDRDIPDQIKAHLPQIVTPFLAKFDLDPKRIQHYLFHPGGKKILYEAEKFLLPYDKNLNRSRRVLQNFGNLSSATVLYILSELMAENSANRDDVAYMLAFGPGFTAQSLLFRWI